MKRLRREDIAEIRSLIQDGVSLNKISRLLNCSKTTVYYHYFKFKGSVVRKVKIRFDSDFEKGEIIGIFAGDGSLWYSGPLRGYHYQIRIHCGCDLEYAKYVKLLFSKSFGKEFSIVKNRAKSGEQYNVQTYSRAIRTFFFSELEFDPHNKGPTVKIKQLNKKTAAFIVGFMKGLLDTDGTVAINDKRKVGISYFSTSKKMLLQLKSVLTLFGINSKIKSHWPKVSINPSGDLIIPNYEAHVLRLKQGKGGQVTEFLNIVRPYKAEKYNLIKGL